MWIMKLIEVIIKGENQYHFIFEGNMVEDEDSTIGYSFSDIRVIEEMETGEKILYKVGGHTWSGNVIDEEYALADVISRYTRATSDDFLYVADGLKEALKPYMEDMGISAEHRISPKILYSSTMEEYTVTMVTDEYAYYVYGDVFLMLDTSTGNVVADNHFAEVGYTDSEEAVKNGKEILLFKEYEFDVADYVRDTLRIIREKNLSEFSYKCLCGFYEEYEEVFIRGTVKDSRAAFEVGKMRVGGQRGSHVFRVVNDLPLTDESIEKISLMAKEFI